MAKGWLLSIGLAGLFGLGLLILWTHLDGGFIPLTMVVAGMSALLLVLAAGHRKTTKSDDDDDDGPRAVLPFV